MFLDYNYNDKPFNLNLFHPPKSWLKQAFGERRKEGSSYILSELGFVGLKDE